MTTSSTNLRSQILLYVMSVVKLYEEWVSDLFEEDEKDKKKTKIQKKEMKSLHFLGRRW